MLVITRKQSQTIIIGETKITIGRIKGGVVKVLIDAPATCRVRRGELERREEEAA